MFVRDFQHPSASAASEPIGVLIFATPALAKLGWRLSNWSREHSNLIEVEEVDTWEDCCQAVAAKKPQVLVLPLRTQQGSANEIYQQICDRCVECSLSPPHGLLLSNLIAPSSVKAFGSSSIRSFCGIWDLDEVGRAIKISAAGGRYLSQQVIRFLEEFDDWESGSPPNSDTAGATLHDSPENPQQQLPASSQESPATLRAATTLNLPFGTRITAREKEVLHYCVLGLTNRQIGERLYISPGTVKTHIDNLFAKLDCSNRTALAVRSLQLGLVEFPASVGNGM